MSRVAMRLGGHVPSHGEGEQTPSRAASAALAVGLLLLLINAPPTSNPDVPCEHPYERNADAGWTRDVGCGASAESGRRVQGPARILFGQGLLLNRANPKALEVLPGIGPSRAASIVRTREARPFDRVEDLNRVPGIGPKTVSGLAGWVSVGAPHE